MMSADRAAGLRAVRHRPIATRSIPPSASSTAAALLFGLCTLPSTTSAQVATSPVRQPALQMSTLSTPVGTSHDLRALLQAALARHPSIAARRQEATAADSALEGARWQRFPSLSVQGGVVSTNSTPVTVSVQQVLWAGGRVDGAIAAADARTLAARAAVVAEEQLILERTVVAYADLQRQQARLAASEANVRRHDELHALISRRVEQQVSSAADAALALARLSQARAERQQIQAAIGNARTTLLSLTGESVRSVVALDAPSPGLPTLADAMAAAERSAPELARQQALAAAAARDVDVKNGQLWPTLAARVEHLRNTAPGLNTSTERALLAFEFAPGSGLSSLSGVREADARRLAALAEIDRARLELEQKLNSAWNDVQAAAAQREPFRLLARTSAALVDSFVRQYTVGRKSWLDVLNTQREAVMALYSLAEVDALALGAALRIRILAGSLSAATAADLELVPLSPLAPPVPLTEAAAMRGEPPPAMPVAVVPAASLQIPAR